MTDEPPAETEIRTFLIADVRGYTLFTQERGDEAAAKLAAKFARIAREEIDTRGGSVIELRGDEALAVFASPRQAIRAAVALQDRFVQETLDDPSLPLTVGIGLDAGEAVPVEGGYRGGALNLAARLCGTAGAGEVLASGEVTHLARHVDGVRYVDRGTQSFKGLSDPIRVMKVVPEDGDPASLLAPPPRAPEPKPRRFLASPRSRIVAGTVAMSLVAGGVAVGVLRGGGGGTDGVVIGPDAVGLIDSATGAVVGRTDVAAGRGGLVHGEGAVWAAGSRARTLLKIDPETRAVVDTIGIAGEVGGIAVAEGFVWVTLGDEGRVERINPSTNEPVAGGQIPVGNAPAGIAAGFGAIWVANRLDATVSRIDPIRGEVTETIPVGDTPTGVTTAADAVWVSNSGEGTVTRIDPNTSAATPIGVGQGPTAIAGSDGAVWVVNGADSTASRIDPERTSVIATVEVGDGPVAIAVTPAAVWVASEFAGTVSRIDPEANGVADVVDVGAGPLALAVVGDEVWIATGAGVGAKRGGTFTFVAEAPFDSIDPALAYSIESWGVLVNTNDGLVGYRRVGGQDGATLVPDLARSLPRPTDGGRTYAFTLRPGIRYSTGAEVRASDVRSSMERVMRAGEASPGTYMFEALEGSEGCARDPETCDLSHGIETNDDTGSVTFHLSRPDPDFLYKLAMPFAYVLPADVPPAVPVDQEPPSAQGSMPTLPATGPYVIAAYELPADEGVPGRIELVRNPHFEEWSGAAQPDGNPDRIVGRLGVPYEEQIEQVRGGDADWMMRSPAPAEADELRIQNAERLHRYSEPATLGFVFNTRVPPFDDRNVRRAVNYALDRRLASEFFPEPRITCQILPRSYPGYRPYCPYTAGDTDSGVWSAPDLARARRLVNASGHAGAEVTVWTMPHPPPLDFLGAADVVADTLRAIGFRVRVRVTDDVTRHFELVSDSRTRAQIFALGWYRDYGAASNFLHLLFSCETFISADPFQTNYAELCDREVDRLIDRAFELQVTEPTAAAEAWSDVDRAIVDLAAWLPLANPGGFDFVSDRVGNYQHHPQWGFLLGQATLR